MRVWNDLMEVNISNDHGNKFVVGISKDHVDSSNRNGQCQRLACLLCNTTHQRIGCTHALIPNRMYCILFNAKRQIELVGPFAKSFHRCPCCMFSASFSARMCCRSACLESEAVLGASLILHASESVFYYVLDRAIAYKKNICIKRVRTMLFAVFAVFLVLEFIA
jgi:hypothetical protein